MTGHDLSDTAELEGDLRDGLRRLLGDHCSAATLAAWCDQGRRTAPELWRELALMGIPGLPVGEEHGGSAGSWALAAAAQEELGRRLAPAPTVSGFAVQAALAAAGTHTDALAALAAGTARAAVAAGRTDDGWIPAPDLVATEHASGWTLDGTVPVVAEAADATLLLAAAGDRLFLVDAAGVRLEPVDALDPTRPLSRAVLTAVDADPVGDPGQAPRLLAAAQRAALVALAADAVGVAAEATDLAVGYARTRRQFGRLIGSFQAVSHRCADMAVAVVSARALVAAAAEALDGPPDADTDIAVALAASDALDTAVAVAAGCIQVHGGIGFTWELPAHRYLRRAKAAQSLIAQPDRLRERAARALLDTAPPTSVAAGSRR
ncbi:MULTISPECIES: acyl-CoA dehydrogenase family protein [Streptacidiphilus]|uniref:Acyl-CoA dehydrogenase family protein n=1 Tax=Streptacidiphilus cavernicola TaxID=3342716 RepID=A0ABV6UUT2_9ACTN|nr:acyl-CoA dehydrogenase family protein [Streptacidiphilus jeojiense]